MSREVIATVVVELSREPGAPPATVHDASVWVEALLNEVQEPEGYNSARYSRARVISASVKPA